MSILLFVFFFSSRRRHTRSCLVSWARRCVQKTKQEQYKKKKHAQKIKQNYIRAITGKLRALKSGTLIEKKKGQKKLVRLCLLYTSDAADDMQCVDLGGRRNIKKKTNQKQERNSKVI
eukprot:TRINITY_DN29220_c0_g1_i2.p3 TRINITY_DN29220_c0_g1~~TRINITY_DN29220_c0_g1_i2.p3  ORF type:complete len:118 (-),score=24.62 TRINITY_DN29220_c0_g1_i2:70-423(-)